MRSAGAGGTANSSDTGRAPASSAQQNERMHSDSLSLEAKQQNVLIERERMVG